MFWTEAPPSRQIAIRCAACIPATRPDAAVVWIDTVEEAFV